MQQRDEAFVPVVTADDALKRRIEEQLDAYLSPTLGVNEQQPPLAWWKAVVDKDFGLLKPVARWCLSIVATSAIVERVFKVAKYVTRDERNRTGDDLVDAYALLAYVFAKDPGLAARLLEAWPVHSL